MWCTAKSKYTVLSSTFTHTLLSSRIFLGFSYANDAVNRTRRDFNNRASFFDAIKATTSLL